MSHQYEHDEYTHPDVFTIGVKEGWAEAETDPARINWYERRVRAAIPFKVVNGRPVNPREKTRVRRGRNEMGWWGENLMADALVTLTCGGSRYLLMVERADGYGWAVPGGRVEERESALDAAVRELREETGLTVYGKLCRELPPRYVEDPRASGEAWAVTVQVHVDYGDFGPRGPLPWVAGGDDALRAEWVPAGTYETLAGSLAALHGGKVFAAHVAMLRDYLGTAEGRR